MRADGILWSLMKDIKQKISIQNSEKASRNSELEIKKLF